MERLNIDKSLQQKHDTISSGECATHTGGIPMFVHVCHHQPKACIIPELIAVQFALEMRSHESQPSSRQAHFEFPGL